MAGPTAVGKTHLLESLAEDDVLRARLGVPKLAPTLTTRELLDLHAIDPIDELILHYDLLRPPNKGFGSYAADPGTAIMGGAETIAFLTLRVPRAQLAAQLDKRLACEEPPPKGLRRLRRLYEDHGFVSDWYERWFVFVECFRAVTVGNYLVEPCKGYRLTPVPAATTHG